ncbi:MAG: hypothetical protein R3B93_17535 [Bacteroidia bacterium]
MASPEETYSKIDEIRLLVSQNKIEVALNSLTQFSDWIQDRKLKNSILLTCARFRKEKDEEQLGIKNNKNERNSVVLSILEFLDELEDASLGLSIRNEENTHITEMSQSDILKSYNLLLRDANNFNILSEKKKEELYVRSLQLKKLMFSKLNEKFKDDYADIIFNRIFFLKNLEEEEIKEISKIPDDNSISWIDKSIIVSALSLSIIQQFNVQKINLLLNFINSFEEKVWQRALVGLVLGLHNRENKILLFPNLINRLKKLQEINEVQNGLRIIASELNRETYKNCFSNWDDTIGVEFKVLRKVEQWFLPFFEKNPILKTVKENFPNVKDIDLFPDLITNDRHLSNSQKYVICLSLPNWDHEKVTELIEYLKGCQHCKKEHIFDPYIADFYFFFKYFSSIRLQSIFNEKIKIYETSLVDVLVSEKKKLLFQGRIEFENENYDKAIEYLKASLSQKESSYKYCLLGMSYFNKNMFDEAIQAQLLAYDKDNEHLHSFEVIYKCQIKLENYEAAINNLIKLKENECNIDEELKEIYRIGIEKYQNCDYLSATLIMEKLIELYPENPDFYCNTGFGYFLLDDIEKFYEFNMKALEIEESVLAYKNLGHYYLVKNNLESAEKHYKKSYSLTDKMDWLSDLIREDFSHIKSSVVSYKSFQNLKLLS